MAYGNLDTEGLVNSCVIIGDASRADDGTEPLIAQVHIPMALSSSSTQLPRGVIRSSRAGDCDASHQESTLTVCIIKQLNFCP